MVTAVSYALQGLQASQNMVAQATENLVAGLAQPMVAGTAGAPTTSALSSATLLAAAEVDPATSLVNLNIGADAFKMNAKTLSVYDDMQKSLMDILS